MEALSAGALGFVVGVLVGRWGRQQDDSAARPLRLITRHEMIAPIVVTDDSVDSQWKTAIVRFAVAAELAGSFSLGDMKRATTITRPAWVLYLSVLRKGGVVTVEDRMRTTWAAEFYERAGRNPTRHLRNVLRAGVIALPYPTRRPPTFLFREQPAQMAQPSTDATDDTE